MLVSIILITAFAALYYGYSYYTTDIEHRFFHPRHEVLKSSGLIGHGMGIIGTLMILFGVFSYMARKRLRKLGRIGLLKHWLEFHIFLCVLGPILIFYHTSMKFGGVVAIGYWSMVAVVLSGVIGRFIYVQIPRSLEGRELSLNEITKMKGELSQTLSRDFGVSQEIANCLSDSFLKKDPAKDKNILTRVIRRYFSDRATKKNARKILKTENLSGPNFRKSMKLLKNEISLNRKIDMLVSMQNLLRYWHVAHLPFAMIMLIIMLIHVTISFVFGYNWIL